MLFKRATHKSICKNKHCRKVKKGVVKMCPKCSSYMVVVLREVKIRRKKNV